MALSWMLMATDGPVANAITARMANPLLETAGIPLAMGLAIWIESPVIDLLTASTTLAVGRESLAMLRRYSLAVIAFVTLAHAVVALTPIYTFVFGTIMRAPVELMDTCRLPFIIMIPWSGVIGWRRFLQGVMIRNGVTKPVGVGSAVRATVMATVGFTLVAFSSWPGLVVVTVALVSSVTAEAIFIHFAARPVIRYSYELVPGEETTRLTLVDLLKFHGPLVASTAVMMIAAPMVSAALLRLENPVVSVAAWQVASSVVFLLRAGAIALPEVVISLARDEESEPALLRFCVQVGLASATLLGVLALLRIDVWFFTSVLKVGPVVAEAAHVAFFWCMALPIVNALMMFARAMLTARRRTLARMVAVMVAIGTMALTLAFGVAFALQGVFLAAAAATIAQTAELTVLWFSLYGKRRRPPARVAA